MTAFSTHQDGRLSSIPGIRPLYFLPDDPFVEEVLIPAFGGAQAVDTMVGFFSSHVLASLAPGLATFINCTEGQFRLLMSPILREEDRRAIEEVFTSAETIVENYFNDLVLTQDLIAQHTLQCLSWLIRTRRIEIKIALMKDALFHPKVWLFKGSQDQVLAAHGSSNFTVAGLGKNIEQVATSMSWGSPEQCFITEKLADQFTSFWEDANPNCVVVSLPEAVKSRLLRTFNKADPPTESELRSLYRQPELPLEDPLVEVSLPKEHFVIPLHLEYQTGQFAHQGEAVNAWCAAGNSGILEMATGSGKTIASLVCAHRLSETHKPLLIVVAAPYVPLIEQWHQEIKRFGITPLNIARVGGPRPRADALGKLRRRLRSGNIEVAAVVVSHAMLSDPVFQNEIQSFESTSLLIADEAHNLGSEGFIAAPPDCFDYKLGLSATPVRQYDETGTEALIAFLGPVVYRYPLAEAIGSCLVEYDYFVHPVNLTAAEMDKWYDITTRIRQNTWREKAGQPDDFLLKLLRDRRSILESAEGKIQALRECLAQEDLRTLRHTLIYTSDKDPAQLEAVNSLLTEQNILFRQLTYEETAHRDDTLRILKEFKDGTLRCLTAKRVLDEGVDIPEVRRAYVLASTTVERQWIQRRGRLLRRCDEIGKTHSEIHDFVVLPPGDDELDIHDRGLARSELRRVQEFAALSRNAGRTDGPLAIIDKLVHSAYSS